MIVNSSNIATFDISKHLHFVIKIVGESYRRGSNSGTNCSGFNINRELVDGMTVGEYQEMIKRRFDKSDLQFSLTKHLKYDIAKGYLELHG
ncbi:hypothetical protein [Atlantibacter hermannii]|uniref:hypothetical protein n=1 Tax=Atlantibacter hermannii TaxID=565 RepID=UPI0028B0BE15|nr:hypothetical protein [Atlantibacter hermannii]